MPAPKKVKEEAVLEVKDNSLELENKQLKEQMTTMNDTIEQLKMMMLQMSTQSQAVVQPTNTSNEVQSNEYIKVMSLTHGLLNLSTQKDGQGTVYEFPMYGDIQEIQFSDIRHIVNSNKRFAKEGFFYIMDARAVKSLFLEKDYETILTKDVIDRIFEMNNKDFLDAFINALEPQKELIVTEFVLRCSKELDESIDYNKVKAMNNHYYKDIEEMIDEYKNYGKEKTE